jgi:SAM-dependent methyltransferase
MSDMPRCWCGSSELVTFSPDYFRCPACETLVSARMPGPEISRVRDDQRDFYGRDYWFGYQEKDLGHPSILERARTDLPERCLHWLRTVLRYKLPPGHALELGSGHGGFVALLQWAGFEATGLEISPWVVEYARATFQAPMMLGPVEDQTIEPGSIDAMILMDVLEHLHDPVSTMRTCLRLLKPDGALFIQTPCYAEGRTYEEMNGRNDRRLEILQPREHLYLFSRSSLRELFARLGAKHVAFEPAIFDDYDMFTVVSRASLPITETTEIEEALCARPSGRLVLALLDGAVELDRLKDRFAESEADRAARLAAIEEQAQRLGEVEAERNNLGAEARTLRQQLATAEADRAARLEVILDQGRRLGEVEAERNNLGAEAQTLRQQLATAEADRAARLEVILDQGRRLGEMEVERNNFRAEIEQLSSQLRALQDAFVAIKRGRAYRLIRKFGRWKFIDQIAVEPPGDSAAGAIAGSRGFDAACESIREPKSTGAIFYEPGAEHRIAERLKNLGRDVRPYEIDIADYHHYLAEAGYRDRFPDYYAFNRPEKSLEHYLAAKLLALSELDVYIDVASEHSPAPDIYRRLFGVKAYRQDLAYPHGIHGERIGGDAARIPVPDGFATKMALHCSFEHFEGDRDIGFVREAERVLRAGGAVCVVPLYLAEEYAIQTDPELSVPAAVAFEEDAVVHCARSWGDRHGRFYDPEHLASRVLDNAGTMSVEIYRITNAEQIDRSCYVRFAMVLRKLQSPPVAPAVAGAQERA